MMYVPKDASVHDHVLATLTAARDLREAWEGSTCEVGADHGALVRLVYSLEGPALFASIDEALLLTPDRSSRIRWMSW